MEGTSHELSTIGALDSRLLRPRHVQRQTAPDDQPLSL
jgi:hypothetical protein